MSGWDRVLPPGDRSDPPGPMPHEKALDKVRRLCREMGIPIPPDDPEPEDREPGGDG